MLIIWNENLIVKNFKIYINKINKKILFKKYNINPTFEELKWIIKILTNLEINPIKIESGYFDYPLSNSYSFVMIENFKLIPVDSKTILLKNHKKSPLILLEILKLYEDINDKYPLKKNKFYLLNNKEIIIKTEDINKIPLISINNSNYTKIIN